MRIRLVFQFCHGIRVEPEITNSITYFTFLLTFHSSLHSRTTMATSSPSILNTNESQNTLISINVSAQTSLKLTSTNYLSWKLQFHTLFIDYDLLGYIDSSKPCTPTTLTQNKTTRTNHAHTLWIQQDQLILNAIIGSISHTIIPFIARTTTDREAWTILATTYAKPCRGHIKQAKSQL